MKRSIILFFVIISIFAVNISAQTNNSDKKNSNLTNAQKMIPFVMGMSLSVLRDRDDKNFLFAIEKTKQIRYFSAELLPVTELESKADKELRQAVVDKASEALKNKMSKPDRWQFLAGDSMGGVYTEIKNAIENQTELDNEGVRFQINIVARLCENPPEDIPADVLKKLTEFGKLADEETYSNKKTMDKLFKKVFEVLDAASSD